MSKAEWTRDLPTEWGYYYRSFHLPTSGRWANPPRPPSQPYIVYVYGSGQNLMVETAQGDEELKNYATTRDLSGVDHLVVLWMGPIDLPDPPEPLP